MQTIGRSNSLAGVVVAVWAALSGLTPLAAQTPLPRLCVREPRNLPFLDTTPSAEQPLLDVTLATARLRNDLGEHIMFTVSARNPAATPVHLASFSAGPFVTVRVTEQATGRLVWDSSAFQLQTADVFPCAIPPHAEQTYTVIWDQRQLVYQATPGPLPLTMLGGYTVSAVYTLCERVCQSNMLALTIVGTAMATAKAEPVPPAPHGDGHGAGLTVVAWLAVLVLVLGGAIGWWQYVRAHSRMA